MGSGRESPTRVRVAAWDWLRVLAAFDTAAHHVAGHHGLWGVGLPLFLLLSVTLSVSRAAPPDSRTFLGKRVERILVPWVFWSLVLSSERAVEAARAGHAYFGWFRPEMLLYGPRIHLWFLPAIFVAGAAAHGAHRVFHKAPFPGGRLPMLALPVAAAVLLTLPVGRYLGWPFEQWLFLLPALPLGWLLGRALARGPAFFGKPTLAVLGTQFAVALAIAALADPDSAPVLLRYGGALFCLWFAVFVPRLGTRYVAMVAPLMLGVYVLHPSVHRLLTDPLLSGLPSTIVSVLEGFQLPALLTFVMSMGLTALLRRTPLKRVL